MDKTPKEVADMLIREQFPIEDYEKLQARREERLKIFQKFNNAGLIEKETELIEHGVKVLEIMRNAQK